VIAFCNQQETPESTNVILHRPGQKIINYILSLSRALVNISQTIFVDDDLKMLTNDDILNARTSNVWGPAYMRTPPGEQIKFFKKMTFENSPKTYKVSSIDSFSDNTYGYSYEMGAYKLKNGNFDYLKNIKSNFYGKYYLNDLVKELPKTTNPGKYNILFLSCCKSLYKTDIFQSLQGIQSPYIQQKITTSPISQSVSFFQQPKQQIVAKTISQMLIPRQVPQPVIPRRRRMVPRQVPQPVIMTNKQQKKKQKNDVILEQTFCNTMARIGKKVLGCPVK
jgi:hypothetical protein